ncbi:universal stress protein [Adhaeribacter aquaticus]|uniref:universal stress protein n=1 Tax=Adhaeribacter aquaticus TaxID=299567 RepID=UPI0004210765|nr:universal stress protein [Adhaeribacter aquaticus]
MKNLLILTDFNDDSAYVLHYAMNLGQAVQGKVFLFHNADLPLDYSSTYAGSNLFMTGDVALGAIPAFPGSTVPLTELEQVQKDKLQTIAANLQKSYGNATPIEALFKWGSLNENISNVVKEAQIDLILIDNNNTNSFLDRLAGTDTGSVINDIPCPVLIIPAAAKFNSISHITYAAEVVENDFLFLDQLIPFAQAFNAQVTLVHIRSEAANETNISQEYIAAINQRYPHLKQEIIELRGKTVAEGLENFVITYKTDVLAIGHYKQGFFSSLFHESITDHLTFRTTIPLLSLPDKIRS